MLILGLVIKKMTEQKIKPIVRVANTDLRGNKAIGIAMTQIKGVGVMFANLACKLAHVDVTKKAGLLDNNEISRITEIIFNPDKHNIPDWMMNRRKDYATGDDKHIVTGDLVFAKEQDLRRLKKIKSYRGLRHQAGLPLRGQRTKSNFRRNKGKAVGVKKKKGAKAGRV
jgi:small subunit ribosomal protein S13